MAGDLLAAALSSTLHLPVLSYEDYQNEKGSGSTGCMYQALNIEDIFRLSHRSAPYGDLHHDPRHGKIKVFIKTLSGKTLEVLIPPTTTVDELKHEILGKEGISENLQRLIFEGKQLEGQQTLVSYGITAECTIHLMLRLSGGGMPTFYVDDSLLDPQYDYDFTHLRDTGAKFYRGDREYHRPYGWKRFALKVLGRHEDDVWLGRAGSRCASSPGEWPVSYHGTGIASTGNIAQEGYLVSKGKRFKFGVGIYSTPSIEVAAKYAQQFTHDGKQYRIVFQNRVNPSELKVFDTKVTGVGEYWVQPHQELVRPYGICIQEC